MAYVIVNEAGASVYSTSHMGREEFPDYDATLRGAISIGRRLQDPLSELVKIDPANIGVGLYQHDVKAKHLAGLAGRGGRVVRELRGRRREHGQPALLRYVSGLNQLTARRLVRISRASTGRSDSREQLARRARLRRGDLRAGGRLPEDRGGDNPLDATWIHPESYPVARQVLEKLAVDSVADRRTGKCRDGC